MTLTVYAMSSQLFWGFLLFCSVLSLFPSSRPARVQTSLSLNFSFLGFAEPLQSVHLCLSQSLGTVWLLFTQNAPGSSDCFGLLSSAQGRPVAERGAEEMWGVEEPTRLHAHAPLLVGLLATRSLGWSLSPTAPGRARSPWVIGRVRLGEHLYL